jgi:ribosome-binding protein aMBF1 (putative translation factor)
MTKLVFQTKDCAIWDLFLTAGDDRADERELRVLGHAIRELRERQGLSRETLAEAAGINAAELAAIEAGRLDPGYRRLRHLARGLGVRPITLLLHIEELDIGDAT